MEGFVNNSQSASDVQIVFKDLEDIIVGAELTKLRELALKYFR